MWREFRIRAAYSIASVHDRPSRLLARRPRLQIISLSDALYWSRRTQGVVHTQRVSRAQTAGRLALQHLSSKHTLWFVSIDVPPTSR